MLTGWLWGVVSGFIAVFAGLDFLLLVYMCPNVIKHQYIVPLFNLECITIHQSLFYFPALCYSVVCPRCARFIAVTLRGQPFLTHVSRCIYLAGLVNVIIMCPLCTVECLARRPSRLLKPSSPVNGLLQPAWGNSALAGRGRRRARQPSWLSFADGTTSSAPFFFFHENPVPVWW